jgi:glycosyltransferase involved in cell wall biosynthesis
MSLKLVLITPYYTLSMQRKVEWMALEEVEIYQVIPALYGAQPNPVVTHHQPRPNHRLVPVKLRAPFNPHQALLLASLSWLKKFGPDLIAVEWDPDTLMATQMALARMIWSPRAKLVLHSWQNLARPLKPQVRAVLSYTLRQADAVCCTNREGPAILRQWGYRGQILDQPWVGVDTSLFYRRDPAALRQSLGLKEGFIAGYVGRLAPEKGIDDFIKAVAQLPTVQCVLVGGGDHEATLRRLAQTEGVAERTHFVGQVPNEELPVYFSMFDVLVLPSRTTIVWKEQYGRVLLEAMACQTPIIGSDSGAIPEVVGEAGLIVPEGDVAALRQAMQKLYDASELGRRLGQHGYARVKAHYSQQQIAARILQTYQQVVTHYDEL